MNQFFGFKKEIWLTLFLLFLFEFGHGFAVIIEDENPLVDLSNGEEFRKMAGYGEERLSTVLVTGSVLCEACLHAESQLHAWPISGAVVGITCHNTGKKTKSSDLVHGVTDEFGDFIIDIPSHLHALHSFEKSCYIKILRVPKNARCKPAHIARHKRVQLSSFGSGIRTYTSGILKLQHQTSKPLQTCIDNGSSNQQSSW